MPTSKQARARQARQKERLAVLQAERAHKKRRNRRWFGAAGALVVIIGILLALFVGPTSGSKNSSSPTTLPAAATTAPAPSTTTAVLKSVKGKPCVAMKAAPPSGAPKVPVQVGPPPTKLVIKDLKVGTGATATTKSKITADYIGVACTTGETFGSSYGSEAFTAQLSSQVIPGWQLGIPGMKVGGERLLGIPSAMASGAALFGPDRRPSREGVLRDEQPEELDPAVHAKLAIGVEHMGLNRSRADVQGRADLTRRRAGGEVPNDFCLARGEPVRRIQAVAVVHRIGLVQYRNGLDGHVPPLPVLSE
jgi:peptidylprolyl isomerase